jgi:sulfite oxidase
LTPTKQLLARSDEPFNGEPPLDVLVRTWITPVEAFFVRSHGSIPNLDAESYRLRIEGRVQQTFSLSLGDLHERFRTASVTATLACAGNRRCEHNRKKRIDGVSWEHGALGTAEWSGVRLSDLLTESGLAEGARHVWFEGGDQIVREGRTICFGASIPIEKAMGDTAAAPGALLAYEMNGEPLSPQHGYPLRTIVPGYIGARSVKWLTRIVVSDRPSENPFQTHDYKLATADTPDAWTAAEPINEFPINSVICSPAADARLTVGTVRVSGYAISPGAAGNGIRAVEVSSDDGRTWTAARLLEPRADYCWQLWEADVSVNQQTRHLIVRAIDSSGRMQPEAAAWNVKGYLYNGWHRVPVVVN